MFHFQMRTLSSSSSLLARIRALCSPSRKERQSPSHLRKMRVSLQSPGRTSQVRLRGVLTVWLILTFVVSSTSQLQPWEGFQLRRTELDSSGTIIPWERLWLSPTSLTWRGIVHSSERPSGSLRSSSSELRSLSGLPRRAGR